MILSEIRKNLDGVIKKCGNKLIRELGPNEGLGDILTNDLNKKSLRYLTVQPIEVYLQLYKNLKPSEKALRIAETLNSIIGPYLFLNGNLFSVVGHPIIGIPFACCGALCIAAGYSRNKEDAEEYSRLRWNQK